MKKIIAILSVVYLVFEMCPVHAQSSREDSYPDIYGENMIVRSIKSDDYSVVYYKDISSGEHHVIYHPTLSATAAVSTVLNLSPNDNIYEINDMLTIGKDAISVAPTETAQPKWVSSAPSTLRLPLSSTSSSAPSRKWSSSDEWTASDPKF